MAVETTQVTPHGAAACGPAVVPGARPAPGSRPARPVQRPASRPASVRPGGRRGGPELPVVRPRVRGGACRGPVPRGPGAAVVRRRRRVAVLALGVVLAALVAVAVSLVGGVSADAVPAATTVTVVQGGESLSDVAHRSAPRAGTAAAVERIRELNGLSSSSVPVGRPLVVPAG